LFHVYLKSFRAFAFDRSSFVALDFHARYRVVDAFNGYRTANMNILTLGAALIVLLIDSAIELALISSMVGYLHRSGANTYAFGPVTTNSGGSTVGYLNAKPKGLLLNEGHTSNGAAGTALVLICFGGFLTLWWQRRRERINTNQRPSRIFLTYTIFTILSFLLTLVALAYTFAVTNSTRGQHINLDVALQYQGDAYPLDKWTPENWTKALLEVAISTNDASYLRHWLHVIVGWKWNLIPMFLIGLVVASLSVMECLRQRIVARGNGREFARSKF